MGIQIDADITLFFFFCICGDETGRGPPATLGGDFRGGPQEGVAPYAGQDRIRRQIRGAQ